MATMLCRQNLNKDIVLIATDNLAPGKFFKYLSGLGYSEMSACKLMHSDAPLLKGVVEMDETYVGGKPPIMPGVKHKRGCRL
jgi:hypothetical protein